MFTWNLQYSNKQLSSNETIAAFRSAGPYHHLIAYSTTHSPHDVRPTHPRESHVRLNQHEKQVHTLEGLCATQRVIQLVWGVA
jgi:hypothetical protein